MVSRWGLMTLAIPSAAVFGDKWDAWDTEEVEGGLFWRSREFQDLYGGKNIINVLDMDYRNTNVTLKPLLPTEGLQGGNVRRCMRTSQQASTTNAIAAVNAGFFNTVLCTSDSMMKENGELRASNPRQDPRTTFGWSAAADGRIENPLIQQVFFDDPWDEVDSALGGGPTIVRNGEVYVTRDEEPLDPGYGAGPKPCSAIALTSDDHLLFMTVDGRVGGLRGLSLEEMGGFLVSYGAVDATNMDGGGSTTMFIDGKGVVNYPNDNNEFDHAGERAVVTTLAFILPGCPKETLGGCVDGCPEVPATLNEPCVEDCAARCL